VRQGPYLNAAALLETALGARALLDALLAIERARGRDRAGAARWGPRTLDLDLLLYGDRIIDEPGLTVPHPRMHERLFVLRPLALIAPEMIVPTCRLSVGALLSRLDAVTPSARDPAV
jgi:2-amino-4-hydroxy-6-hydroxymethyldihydropteridine diphosphokinase